MDSRQGTIGIVQRLVVNAYGRVVMLERNDNGFELPYLPVPWTVETSALPVDRCFTATCGETGTWDVSIDGQPPIALISSEAVTEHIENDLHHWLATYTRDFLFVHAGCVSWRNRAIIIPGRSYAGKTTLTQALLEAGATYYSDDYAIIDKTGNIHPFPRSLRVRPQSPGRTERVDPIDKNWPIGSQPIRAGVIAALTYDTDAGWNVETLSLGAGTLSLLDNTVAARERPEDALRMMSIATHGAVAIKGTRDDAASSARRLLTMIDELLDLDE